MCSPSTMDKGTVGADHPFLTCVTFANGMKVDGKQEGQSTLPKRRWSAAKPTCISHFLSLCRRIPSPSKLAVSQLWRWAEGEGWAAATFLSRWGKEPTGCLLLSHGGWKHRDGRMLSIALPGNFTLCQGKPECLSKRSGTELSSEKQHEIIKQRHIAPG